METNELTAYLFGNGSTVFFGEQGQQIDNMQCAELSRIHRYPEEYPDGKVYWVSGPKSLQRVTKKALPHLLERIKKPEKLPHKYQAIKRNIVHRTMFLRVCTLLISTSMMLIAISPLPWKPINFIVFFLGLALGCFNMFQLYKWRKQ